MNKLVAVAVIAVSVFSAKAQNLQIIPSNIQTAYQENNDNAAIISDNSSTPHWTDTLPISMQEKEIALVPGISDSEIEVINQQAEAYKWNRICRLASSKTPRYSIESLRSIHGNEKVVQEIAYDRNLPQVIKIHKNIFTTIASLFAKKQASETQTQVANGY